MLPPDPGPLVLGDPSPLPSPRLNSGNQSAFLSKWGTCPRASPLQATEGREAGRVKPGSAGVQRPEGACGNGPHTALHSRKGKCPSVRAGLCG